METATMSSRGPSLPLSMIGEAKATDSEIDAYATKTLKTMSPSDTLFIDDSLGPYVTSMLRCADIQDKNQVTTLAEYDSILELLEDQCSMGKKEASDCVVLIAEAVITGVLPFSERTSATQTTIGGCSIDNFGLYTPNGGGMGSFQSMMAGLPNSIDTIVTTNATPLSKIIGRTDAGGPSPLKPDNLIPIDLMGELDDPSPEYSSALHGEEKHQSYSQTYSYKESFDVRETIQSPQISIGGAKRGDDFPPLGSTPEAFPPLGASSEKPKKSRSSKKSFGKSQQHSDKDLAATLFRPARPRQNSIESEEAASRSRGSSNASASITTMTSTIDEGSTSTNSFYFQQQLNSCVDILLSMNPELAEEAATAAGIMANTDFNLAQHIIDSAMSAPPICRHMLHNGCYRSDCTFSHDVEAHTCLFWLRGRCGKGTACKFLHGFHEKLLKGIDTSKYQTEQQNNTKLSSPGYNQLYPAFNGSSPSSSSCALAFSSSMNVSLGGSMSPLLSSSWQTTPSLEGTSAGSVTSMPSSSSESAPFSFANIASKGYDKNQFSEGVSSPSFSGKAGTRKDQIRTVRIPQDLWNAHENRDSSVFHISDPLERYQKVATSITRTDVIDLHFQSVKTFPIVLETMLPLKLNKSDSNQVWIITGTGHHVGSKTHQKGGGALESAVIAWLVDQNYKFCRGKDKNGQGGALLVTR